MNSSVAFTWSDIFSAITVFPLSALVRTILFTDVLHLSHYIVPDSVEFLMDFNMTPDLSSNYCRLYLSGLFLFLCPVIKIFSYWSPVDYYD